MLGSPLAVVPLLVSLPLIAGIGLALSSPTPLVLVSPFPASSDSFRHPPTRLSRVNVYFFISAGFSGLQVNSSLDFFLVCPVDVFPLAGAWRIWASLTQLPYRRNGCDPPLARINGHQV
jgi:hypothetical protein